MNHYEFYPGIDVYQGLFKDLDKTMRYVRESEDKGLEDTLFNSWKDWYTFGRMMNQITATWDMQNGKYVLHDGALPTQSQQDELDIYQEFLDLFHLVLNDYIDRHGHREFVDKNRWDISGPSLCKYIPDGGVSDELAMNYHTDYQNEFEGAPGWKFGFTVTMYLNDDYDGGGVDFLNNNLLSYFKPKAGDITVFPAGSPDIEKDNLYLHAVKKVTGQPKYFIRMNYRYWKDGSSEYEQGILDHGKEKWEEMCEKKYDQIRSDFHKKYSVHAINERIK